MRYLVTYGFLGFLEQNIVVITLDSWNVIRFAMSVNSCHEIHVRMKMSEVLNGEIAHPFNSSQMPKTILGLSKPSRPALQTREKFTAMLFGTKHRIDTETPSYQVDNRGIPRPAQPLANFKLLFIMFGLRKREFSA